MANREGIKPFDFTSNQSRAEAAKNGRKGGIASGIKRREKNAARKYLAMAMAYRPRLTAAQKANLKQMGADLEAELTAEQIGMIALTQRVMRGDIRAIKLYLSMFEEDPRTLIEKERLKVQKDAVEAIKNADGFMEAMKGVAEEVFADGGDTPDDLEG